MCGGVWPIHRCLPSYSTSLIVTFLGDYLGTSTYLGIPYLCSLWYNMDPVSALGLASSVLQVVNFTGGLISKSRQLYQSVTGNLI